MAIPAYMKIEGIEGDCPIVGREGMIEVLDFDHRVYLPIDRDTGGITGTRKHDPIKLIKRYDKASPLIYKAVCEGNTIAKITIEWFRIDDEGAETAYFQHELENVKMSSARSIMYNVKDKKYEHYVHMEEICIRYQKIFWKYLEGGIEHSDSWLENR